MVDDDVLLLDEEPLLEEPLLDELLPDELPAAAGVVPEPLPRESVR
ncbi:hypothetical protein Cme02nite_68460 [Catellatospora methionotrophica]|uniref:Uncharacterized protein n=1 Tax=Catellatospora methionotrophica TaxID=121620 RepID=A0A8J3PJ83_9ACTN|nr:hypothetical protein Cme02nite_68460 [Catellatospora methionotrophica]